jgi:hypothetical protein
MWELMVFLLAEELVAKIVAFDIYPATEEFNDIKILKTLQLNLFRRYKLEGMPKSIRQFDTVYWLVAPSCP